MRRVMSKRVTLANRSSLVLQALFIVVLWGKKKKGWPAATTVHWDIWKMACPCVENKTIHARSILPADRNSTIPLFAQLCTPIKLAVAHTPLVHPPLSFPVWIFPLSFTLSQWAFPPDSAGERVKKKTFALSKSTLTGTVMGRDPRP